MDTIEINGGKPLRGTVRISGAKNAALPILCASLLAEGESTFRHVPNLRDIHTTLALLGHIGLKSTFKDGIVRITHAAIDTSEAPYELVKKMRASVLVLGPLAAKHGKARVSLPGGCAIGARPIDKHLRGLEAMGAHIELDHGYVNVRVPSGRLKGADIRFDTPTVTGTENLMCAAALAQGRSTLSNAAKEPEVEELAHVLNKMGASIQGAGSDTIQIEGVDTLHAVDHAIMPDRIEAGTYMVAAACTGGEVTVEAMRPEHLHALISKMQSMGVVVERCETGVVVAGEPPYRPVDVVTAPHPGFPTDMQAQFMVLMSRASGAGNITETIFENRFMHVSELLRMGARINLNGRTATVHGVDQLQGADVMATDLRASASLVIAGLVASGHTRVRRVYHLDRGYEHMEKKLAQLGADIARGSVPAP